MGYQLIVAQGLEKRVQALQAQQVLPADHAQPVLDACKNPEHGDYATPVAFAWAKQYGQTPRYWAECLITDWELPSGLEAHIAGAGFVNFRWTEHARWQHCAAILEQGAHYGQSAIGQGKRVYLEYVSANPTGPLHVGHGRSAAYGSALRNVLHATGFDVHAVYYVNDAGRQMHILALSVYLRYLQNQGFALNLPAGAYQGDYIQAIAQTITQIHGTSYVPQDAPDPVAWLMADLPDDPDAAVDQLIGRVRTDLGQARWDVLVDTALHTILEDIQADLADFRVHYDAYFSERELLKAGAVDQALANLSDQGLIYVQDGAQWFASTRFGDDKDRVVRRENGELTYFASDIAYHHYKLQAGFDLLIDVFGADHHGYVPRLRAAVAALGYSPDCLKTPLVQFAILYRGKNRVQMSTRSGSFVTLRALRQEVGVDATRFFYLMRKAEQHMDFDLELATAQNQENPVYYVQYAYARIQRVLEECVHQNRQGGEQLQWKHWALLTAPEEKALIWQLGQYSDCLVNSALSLEVHRITQYLRDLAGAFHRYYNACPFIVDEQPLFEARIALIRATAQVLHNALGILGVHAPHSM